MTATKRKATVKNETARKEENTLAIYLREINRIPLLTREEEQHFAREAAKGNTAAKDKLATANLRFVVNVAKKYQGQGLPLEDLISEGNIGLLNAIERYDVEKGYHFISYAVWWIRQAILKAICEKSRMIRLPLNRANELVQIEKARKLVQDGHSTEKEVHEIARMLDMGPAHVADIINISRELVSLESPVYSDKDSSLLGDFIEDKDVENPANLTAFTLLQEQLMAVLSTLPAREQEVLKMRFGLDDGYSLTLEEVGLYFNVTRERIRQIEAKALRRLSHPKRSNLIKDYLDR